MDSPVGVEVQTAASPSSKADAGVDRWAWRCNSGPRCSAVVVAR
jgi:hypothetical protein